LKYFSEILFVGVILIYKNGDFFEGEWKNLKRRDWKVE
jgi:hypothetical protein